MVTDGRVHDIDKDDMDRWCEYIFYRGLHRTAYARISRGSVTDTELQVGQFAIPSYVGSTLGEEEMPEADCYCTCVGGRKNSRKNMCVFSTLHHHPRVLIVSVFGRPFRPQVVP